MSDALTTWYLEPRDPDTNRVIAENLPAEAYIGEKFCSDGKLHNLWECSSHAIIAYMERARRQIRLDFAVFVQEGRHGQIKPWVFERPKVPAVSAITTHHFRHRHHVAVFAGAGHD